MYEKIDSIVLKNNRRFLFQEIAYFAFLLFRQSIPNMRQMMFAMPCI